jgi:hypothetical protein
MGRGIPVLAFLRSRTLTVWLVGLFVLYYLTMAVWVGEAFGRYVTHLSSSNFFQAFYLLFFVNVLLRSCDALRGAWPHRPAVFLRLPLYLGLIIFLAAFFLSLNFRKTEWLPPMGRGDVISVPWEAQSYQIKTVVPALEKKVLRTDNDTRIFDFEPGITMVKSDGEQFAIGAFPPRKIGYTYYHILMFGIGPGIELRKRNEIVNKGFMALRLVPFGVADHFEIQPFPYKFYLTIVPNRLIKKGAETARDYDLEHPRYRVEIAKGDEVIAKAETETSVQFDGEMELSFFEPDDWVVIEAVRDPFVIWFVIGFAMLFAGVFLYPCTIFLRK